MRPRRLSGGIARPLNFTVRSPSFGDRGFACRHTTPPYTLAMFTFIETRLFTKLVLDYPCGEPTALSGC